MKVRAFIRMLLAAILIAAALSCTRESVPVAKPTGSVSLCLETGLLTRSATPGDGVAADGGGIAFDGADPDVKVFIVNGSGSIIARYPDGGVNATCVSTATTATVRFISVPEGNYTVYAFANTTGLSIAGSPDWSTSGFASLADLQFSPLAANTAPTCTRLPLTASGPLEVNADENGEVHLELIRCTAKVSVELVNLTGNPLSLTDVDIKLRNLCPDRGYLFRHDPDIPSTATYGYVPFTGNVSIAANASVTLSALVFPGVAAADREYTCDISFTEGGSPCSFSDLPILDYRAQELASLSRNQHLTVKIRISRGHTVSFNFEVVPWSEVKNEYIDFN